MPVSAKHDKNCRCKTRTSVAGTGDLQAQLQAAGSDDPNDPKNAARVQAGYEALGSAIVNGKVSDDQAVAIMIGAATLINPALGVALGVEYAIVQFLESEMTSAFQALGWSANGGPPYNPCDNPPSGPDDPTWVTPVYPWGGQGSSVFPPGSFSAIASAVLAQNSANYANCRPSVEVWTLLRQLAEIWNNARDNQEQIWYVGQDGPIVHVPASGFGPAGYIQYDPFLRGTVQWDEGGGNRKVFLSNWNNAQPIPTDIITSLRINRGPLKPQYVPHPKNIGKGVKQLGQLRVTRRFVPNRGGTYIIDAAVQKELADFVKKYTGKTWNG